MSRDPPPGSRYYRDSDSEPEREQKPNPTQASARPVMCRHEEYEHVEFADYGPVPGETVTSSSTPTPRYPVTTTYAAASIYVSAPSYAEQPIYADQQMYAERPTYASAPIYARASTCANSVCAEKTHLPLPSTSPKLRRSRLSRSVRAMFWVVGLVTLAAYASGLGPFRPLAFPVRCDLTKELGADLPLRASVDPLPREFVEKCNNLLKVPKGTFSERLKKLGAKLGQHVYVMEPGPTALYYVGAFGPGSWSASERPFLLAVNSTGQLSILTPRFEEARARLKGLPEEVESTWVPWDEHQSPYVVLSAHFENPAWIVDGNVRAFVTYGLQRHGKPEDAKDAEKVLRDVQSIRERKDGREIELLRCANQFTLHAIRCTRARMQLGITEGQTRKILYEEMKALGLQDYGALVLFGENAALPHGSGTEARLGKEDFALIDAGATWGGYVADITRTFFLPESDIPDAHRSVWEIVRSAQLAPSNFLRLTTPSEPALWSWMDDRARETIKKGMAYLGVPPQRGHAPDYTVFTHRLGHGVGLEGHEAPYAVQGPLGERPVLAGHTVSQEPGVYIPKGGVGHKDVQGLGVRLEDCAVVIEDREGRLRLDWFTGPVDGWGDV